MQSVVGLLAGLTSIAGAGYSAVQYVRAPSSTGGEIVAVLRDAGTDAPVRDATVEIPTPADALVTTVIPSDDGSARQALKEGTYRVRVNHPRYGAQSRDVQVFPGQTAEVRFELASRADAGRARGGSPLSGVTRGVKQSAGAAQRFFRGLTR